MKHTELDGVSVAQGAIGNTWIFAQAKALVAGRPALGPGVAEQRRVLEMQCESCLTFGDAARVVPVIRTFDVKVRADTPALSDAFAVARTLDDCRGVLDRWYPADADGVTFQTATAADCARPSCLVTRQPVASLKERQDLAVIRRNNWQRFAGYRDSTLFCKGRTGTIAV